MNKGMTLYNISGDLRALLDEEELTNESIAKIEELGQALEVKAGDIVTYCDELKAFADMCKAEEARISAKRKAVEAKHQRLKDYLQSCMETAEVMVVECGTKTVKLQKNPQKVVVDDQEKIPGKYFEIVPETVRLDKKTLLADLKKKPVEGAHLEQGLSLRVR